MSAIKRPVQIEEFVVTLREVQDSELYSVKEQLKRSIEKLEKTNNKLTKLINKEELNSESDDSDDELNAIDQNDEQLFKDIIAENQIVARNQQERVEAVNNELSHRGLPIEESGVSSNSNKSTTTVSASEKLKERSGIDTDNSAGDANAPNSLLL